MDWTDDGSGIKKFHVGIYYFQPSADNSDILEQSASAIGGSEKDVDVGADYTHTVPNTGVYGIVVTAEDVAGNRAIARKMFNYIKPGESTYVVDSSSIPVHISQANSEVNYNFITTLVSTTELTLSWKDHYHPSEFYSTMVKRVKELTSSPDVPVVDDNYGTQFGRRSIKALSDSAGISTTQVKYLVDRSNGGYDAKISAASEASIQDDETATLTFNGSPLQDGHTIVVWFNATSMTGKSDIVQINVTVDTSRPVIEHEYAKFEDDGVEKDISR